ncbi:MAG TPA: GNAT family N-acetyltransferase [Thermoleophilia bacterium]|nr:GNAT family N-acetyltransferase [Thermoleophilia bacterium]
MTKTPAVTCRLADAADAASAAGLVMLALNDLLAKQNRPPLAATGETMVPVFGHVMTCCPERFWVAEAEGEPVGFGAGLERGDLRYLAGLFVHPGRQGQGVGGELLRRAMAPGAGAAGKQAVLSSGANQISNGLYARHGMYPLMPALSLTGKVPAHLDRPPLGSLVPDVLVAADAGTLRDVDVAVTSIDRTADHDWLLGAAERRGWVFRRGAEVAGYAYLGGDGTDEPGSVGPVAALQAPDAAAILGFALAQLGVGEEATVMVPGANQMAQQLLWGAGFGLAGPVGLLGVSEPFGQFDRYIFAGNSLM